MSAATAKARPAARPELRREEVREFHIVEGARPRRSAVAILMLLVAVALASVVVSMVLNTRMAQTSFEIREQQLTLNGARGGCEDERHGARRQVWLHHARNGDR